MNMLKKSKTVALLTVSVMMFAVVQPAFAWGNRTGSRGGDAAAYGTGAGAVAAPVAAPYVAGVVGAGGAAATAGKEFLKSTVDEFKKKPIKYVIDGIGTVGTVKGIISLPQILEKSSTALSWKKSCSTSKIWLRTAKT